VLIGHYFLGLKGDRFLRETQQRSILREHVRLRSDVYEPRLLHDAQPLVFDLHRSCADVQHHFARILRRIQAPHDHVVALVRRQTKRRRAVLRALVQHVHAVSELVAARQVPVHERAIAARATRRSRAPRILRHRPELQLCVGHRPFIDVEHLDADRAGRQVCARLRFTERSTRQRRSAFGVCVRIIADGGRLGFAALSGRRHRMPRRQTRLVLRGSWWLHGCTRRIATRPRLSIGRQRRLLPRLLRALDDVSRTFRRALLRVQTTHHDQAAEQR
jgi:hypothetical protein